jgi:hypothetical protein
MKQYCARCLGLLLLISLAETEKLCSQDVWLRPDKYFYEVGDTAHVLFASGEDFIARPFLPTGNEIELLELQSKESTSDVKSLVGTNERQPLNFLLPKEGYHFLFYKTSRSQSMTADEFNEFLKQYGLDEIIADRKTKNELAKSAAIRARNTIQLAFRVGKSEGQGWNQVSGLPIEIIPDKNPQTLKRGDRIEFTIYENGSPAFGVRVKIWNRWDKRTTIQNIYTEKNGTVTTTISNPGDWMVTVVKMVNGKEPNVFEADVFSLNFGYR